MPRTDSPVLINGRFLTQLTTGEDRAALALLRQLYYRNPGWRILTSERPLHPTAAQANLPTVGVSKLTGALWEQLALPAYAYQQGNLPVLLCLTGTAPLFYPNSVITVHANDIKRLTNPLTTWAIRQARAISVLDEAIRAHLIAKLQLDSAQVHVIPHDVSDAAVLTQAVQAYERLVTLLGNQPHRE